MFKSIIVGSKPIGTVGFMAGVPSVMTPFWMSCIQMVQYNQELFCGEGEYIHYARATISDHAAARNSLVKSIYGDWVVMLDTDHSFEPDIIERMLYWANNGNCDVLVGLYRFKAPPYSPVLYIWDEESGFPSPIADYDKNADLIRVGSSGGGCMFVRRHVFDRMKSEYPDSEPYDHVGKLSEDHSFFSKCRDLDIPVWCCPKIHSDHLIIKSITDEDFNHETIPQVSRMEVDGMKQ